MYHTGDTDTYIGFDGFGNEVNVNAGGSNILNANLGGVEVKDILRGINHSNSYLQWHDTNQMRMVVAGVERLEVKHTSPHVLVTGDLEVTGTLIGAGASGGGSDQIFYENDQTVTTNYTITNNKNAMSAGPITVNSGVTVTVGDGETWTVV